MTQKKNTIWGWTNYEYAADYDTEIHAVGRVSFFSRGLYKLITQDGQLSASLPGSFHFQVLEDSDFPQVGDYVLYMKNGDDTGQILKVLPRMSVLSRKVAGSKSEEQVMASNVNIVFIVMSIEGSRSFTAGGLERYLATVQESGAKPVVILSKQDLCPDTESFVADAISISGSIPVHTVSVVDSSGMDVFDMYLSEGMSCVFIGPSGAGKSSLTNYLLGESVEAVSHTRKGDRSGRHTTSHRNVYLCKNRAVLIDTPGMRELQLWVDDDSLDDVFDEISSLAGSCKFSDCSHNGEPACAVQDALVSGALSLDRYSRYLDLKEEAKRTALRKTKRAQKQRDEKFKAISKFVKEKKKFKKKNGLF